MARVEMLSGSNVVRDFHDAARRHGDRPAITDGERSVTYAELEDLVREATRSLQVRGIRAGNPVRFHGPISPNLVGFVLGAWSLGAVVWLDAQEATITGATATFVLSVNVDPTGEATVTPDHRVPAALARAVSDIPNHRGELARDGGGYLVRTSGSTGGSKTILGSLRSLSAFLAWQRTEFQWRPQDRVAALTGLNFDVVYREIFTTLTSGATVVCAPPDLPPSRVVPWLEESKVTILHAVPSLARYWLAASRRNTNAGPEDDGLRATFFAGEPLDIQLVQKWREATGAAQDIINLYGPSETTLAKFHFRVPPEQVAGSVPVGRPLPGSSVVITDPHTRMPVPHGGVGEVVITTSDGSFGYLGDPDPEANSRFQRHNSGSVVFRTGDLGTIRSGELVLLGRLDSRLKINGVWVNLHDIETVLRQHPVVEEAAVVDNRTARGTRLAAFVVLREPVELQQLRSHVLEHLGRAAVPNDVIPIDALPRLATGKIDRIAIRRHGRAESTPVTSHRAQRVPLPSGRQASSPVRQGDAQAVVEVIERAAEVVLTTRVSQHTDLIDCGLDLTTASQLCATLETELGTACSPRDVLTHPTPQSLTQLLLARYDADTQESGR